MEEKKAPAPCACGHAEAYICPEHGPGCRVAGCGDPVPCPSRKSTAPPPASDLASAFAEDFPNTWGKRPPASDALPPCPLHPVVPVPFGDGMCVCCANKRCPLGDVAVLPDEWRRLASPALPETVVAVLRDAEWMLSFPACPYSMRVSVEKWIAAGRPGLPKEGK